MPYLRVPLWLQMIKEIMREATGFEDDAGLTVAFKDAILAHPRLLLLRSEILRYRWRMLGHTAAMHGPWREEIRQFRQDPVAIALLLSRSRQTMKRLDFVVQHGIGAP